MSGFFEKNSIIPLPSPSSGNREKPGTKSLFWENPLRNKKTRKLLIHKSFRVARDKGFEPLTFWSVARRSIQLS